MSQLSFRRLGGPSWLSLESVPVGHDMRFLVSRILLKPLYSFLTVLYLLLLAIWIDIRFPLSLGWPLHPILIIRLGFLHDAQSGIREWVIGFNNLLRRVI